MTTRTKYCGCCGGRIPPETSEAWRNSATGECPGALATRNGQAVDLCGAFDGSVLSEPEGEDV